MDKLPEKIADEIPFEIKEALKSEMENVPFGNSVFQIQNFTGGMETPERRYRTVLLNINQKMKALQECIFTRKRIQVDIDEISEKISAEHDKFERRRMEIDLEENQFKLESEIKLIKDAAVELNAYIAEWQTLPKVSREQFENSELGYWKTRFINDASAQYKSSGMISSETIKALEKLNVEIKQSSAGMIEFHNQLSLLENEKKEGGSNA